MKPRKLTHEFAIEMAEAYKELKNIASAAAACHVSRPKLREGLLMVGVVPGAVGRPTGSGGMRAIDVRDQRAGAADMSKLCENCRHYTYPVGSGTRHCMTNHKARFIYADRADADYGYRPLAGANCFEKKPAGAPHYAPRASRPFVPLRHELERARLRREVVA